MIDILSVTNAHLFDGIRVTEQTFATITEALRHTQYSHTIEYIKDGQRLTAIVS